MATIERQSLVKQTEEFEAFLYHDYPPMNSSLIDNLPNSGDAYDTMIFLFKDSVSFGILYDFFEGISTKK